MILPITYFLVKKNPTRFQKNSLETWQHITSFAARCYKLYEQAWGKIFQKKYPHRFPNLPAGCSKAEKLLCHNCSMLRFGLEAGLAKKQVSGIVSFGKVKFEGKKVKLVWC